MVQIPGLGMLNKTVNTNDVLSGAAFGFAGTLLLKGLGNKLLAGKVPDAILKGSPLMGGLITGGILYALTRKTNKSKADAQLFGALTAGASVQAWDVLKTSFPEGLGDVVSLNIGNYRRGGYGSVIVDEKTPDIGPGGAAYAGYNGLIVDEGSRSMGNLGQLAAMSMGDGESSGMEELMDLD